MTSKCPKCGRFIRVVVCPESELGFGVYCKNCDITGFAKVVDSKVYTQEQQIAIIKNFVHKLITSVEPMPEAMAEVLIDSREFWELIDGDIEEEY